jgi:hypothetical protein
MPNDLWPSNIADANLTTPVSILKQQAALLGEKTRQLVTGEVTTQTSGNMFVHYFFIVAPTLNYRYELFQIKHGINFYPIALEHLKQTARIESEAAFLDKLKEIFSSQHTVNTVQSLLGQVRP